MGREDHYEQANNEDGRSISGESYFRDERLHEHGNKLKKIKNDGGITIGIVFDACTELAEAPRLCPKARESLYDRDG